MNQLAIPIFPDGSLASSVITTVWVGVFVVCLLNLRFGWVLSGLVVPGYLVPLLIAKPLSALVVLTEASLTYFIFWLVSEKLAAPNRWSSFFGRDRFMGLILVSVAVRLVLDGWLLPVAANVLTDRYGWELDWQHNLHSFGLIVVALLANQIWKPGYLRGMTHALVMIGATFIIVRYGLMEFTNFRIGAVVYLYEDFASSVFASPKAYIILISTCLIASRMNLRYGWDFSGILIPALLALQWYQPWKILTSFVEALIIYLLAIWLLSSRFFANATVEGGSKILLFFNISFAYKLALGHGLAWAGIEHRITDYYGFGYLLPTLIAIKAHDKAIWTRLTRATLQVSFLGAVVGSLAGFALTLLIPADSTRAAASGELGQPQTTAARFVAESVGAARIATARDEWPTIAPAAAPSFRSAIEMIDGGRADAEVNALLREAGYRLHPLADELLAVRGEKGGAAFIFNPRSKRSLALTLPEPADSPGLGLAALSLFEGQDARWLVIGGTSRPLVDGVGTSSPADEFVEALSLPRLEIVGEPIAHPTLHIAGATGRQLDFAQLREVSPDLRFTFVVSPRGDVSQIRLPPVAVRQLLERPLQSRSGTTTLPDDEPLSTAALAFLRFDLIDPLIDRGRSWSSAGRTVAAAVGLNLTAATTVDGKTILTLRRPGRFDELYLLRPGATGPVLLVNAGEGLGPIAASLFSTFNARAVLVAPLGSRRAAPDSLQALLTQAAQPAEGGLTIQLRSRRWAANSQDGSAMVVAVDRLEPSPGLGERLVEVLRKAGHDARLANRDAMNAGLEIGRDPQFRYLQQARGGRVAIVWIAAPEGLAR